MIRGTRPPPEWPDVEGWPEYVALWNREKAMLDAFLTSKRSQRSPAVELSCVCPKSHLLLSVFALPADEAALWFHGGGRCPDGYLITPDYFESAIQPIRQRLIELGEHYPHWQTMPDSLEIRPLAPMRAGVLRLGNVYLRCSLPHTLSPTDDGPMIAAAVDGWKAGYRDAPSRARLIVDEEC